MPDLSTIILFLVAAVALLLVPGPVVLFTVARTIEQGRRAGFVSVLAAGIGDSSHVLAATVGFSALLASSALAFDVVKYAGAAYLIYLGIRTLAARSALAQEVSVPAQRLRQIFSQGVIVSVLNPKTALFFLAFLPQFVQPGRGNESLQMLALGTLFVLMGLVTNSLYVLLAAEASAWFKQTRVFRYGQRYIAGGIYLLLGVTTALSGSQRGK